jgi:hypothetical protein
MSSPKPQTPPTPRPHFYSSLQQPIIYKQIATNQTLQAQAQAQTLIPIHLHNSQYQHPRTFIGQPPMLLVTQQPQPISIQYVANSQCTEIFKETNKPTVLNSSVVRYIGSLKFFDENKGFGFITRDADSGDIF